MECQVNGKKIEWDESLALAELIKRYSIYGQVAVALNETLVPRSNWSSAYLKEGDRIEIIHAVQGG